MDKIHKEVREKTIGYILTALGLVAGLAWNEAIKALIDILFPLEKDSLAAKLVYAAIITLAVVIVAGYLTRFASKKD